MDKFCPRCGTPLEEGAKFCSKCGRKVEENPIDSQQKEDVNQPTKKYEKAPLDKRFFAWLLDGLICVGLSLPTLLFYALGTEDEEETYYILALLFFIIPLFYSFVKDGLNEGQSYGKKAMGIKVVNINDLSNCTRGTSCIRTLIYGLANCIPYVGWLIEPIMVFVGEDNRRLGDKLAGTIVIKA